MDKKTTTKLLTTLTDLKKGQKENREMIDFLVENAVTKTELHKAISASESRIVTHMRGEIHEVVSAANSKVVKHIDDFITLHKCLETEVVANRSKSNRLESHIFQIADHVDLKLKN